MFSAPSPKRSRMPETNSPKAQLVSTRLKKKATSHSPME